MEDYRFGIAPDNMSRGVHVSHCCAEHGCMYGNENCPVAGGYLKAKYKCEACSDGY